jgi:hypothetical protein
MLGKVMQDAERKVPASRSSSSNENAARLLMRCNRLVSRFLSDKVAHGRYAPATVSETVRYLQSESAQSGYEIGTLEEIVRVISVDEI